MSTANTDHTLYRRGFQHNQQKKTLNGVPLWKLFIDLKCHDRGEMAFDTGYCDGETGGEPGYAAAMHAAFKYMLTHLHKKLDADEFLDIHHLCMRNVKNIEHAHERAFKTGCYVFVLSEATPAAKLEWESEKLIYDYCPNYETFQKVSKSYLAVYTDRYAVYTDQDIAVPTIRSTLVSESAGEFINSTFSDYYKEIEIASSNDDKLFVIVALCRKIEVSHVFPDGNQRTIVFVLLNKLLLENGFSPAILDNPNVFDGYLSKGELVESVKKGMEHFKTLSKNYAANSESPHVNRFTTFGASKPEVSAPTDEIAIEEDSKQIGKGHYKLLR